MDPSRNFLYHSFSSAPLGGWIHADPSAYAPQVLYSPVRLENINCVVEATNDRGAIFLGDVISIKKEDLLRDNNIRAVLSCSIEAGTSISYEAYNPYDTPNHAVEAIKAIPAEDLYTYDISKHFEEAIAFID